MGLLDSEHYQHPRDLLCRFAPTPLRARFRFGVLRVTVETNDFSLFPVLPLDTNPCESPGQAFHWKLVRDANIFDLLDEPVFLTSPGQTLVGMGPACLVGVDHQRRELVGFIGAGVDAHTFREFLAPVLCRLTNQVVAAEPLSSLIESWDGPSRV